MGNGGRIHNTQTVICLNSSIVRSRCFTLRANATWMSFFSSNSSSTEVMSCLPQNVLLSIYA